MEMLRRINRVLQITRRKCYNVSGTCYHIFITYQRDVPKETVTTCQERLESSLKKMLQRIQNALQAA